MQPSRRAFIAGAAAALLAAGTPGQAEPEKRNGIPYRVLGKTGQAVSLLGLGGAHIGQSNLTESDSIKLMRTAVDEGVNFFDNAWHYNGGESERRMGKALKDGYRDKVFLMTKNQGRDRKQVQEQLEESLRRLQVDRLDLWQFHEIVHPGEPRKIYSGDAIEYILKAREEGKVRFIGFTGHHLTSTHLEMLAGDFDWDTLQMPLNVFDAHFRSFQLKVLPKAVERNMGIIAMKTQGGSPGNLPATGAVTHAECLHYAMNLPVSTVLSGMDSLEILQKNLATARAFMPLEETARLALLEKARPFAEKGEHEPYKTVWHRDIEESMRQFGAVPS
ncbi:MAG: aldo/keto reductase [Candidatus Hydrogenedentes bacterium]|nr:aldo/keto reductase [Candidatus Hydrogenedentota bacterium]